MLGMLLPAAAGTALGATALVSAGAVPIGGTSALPATFTFTENSVGGFPSIGGTITVTILDANNADTLAFTNATGGAAVPNVDAPIALGASAVASGNTFTVTVGPSNPTAVESITVSNLFITASANAAIGPISATSSGTIDASAYGAATTTAGGTLAMDYTAGAPSVVVNLTSTCPFVNAGTGAGPSSDISIAGNDAGAAVVVSAVGGPSPGQQTLSGFSASLPALLKGMSVSQSNVPNCAPGSLGTVGVVGGSISGAVTGPGGAPLASIRMVACPPAGWPCSFANSATDGTYLFTGLPVGPYQVSFGDPNHVYPIGFYAPGQPGNFTLDASAVAGQYVSVPANGVALDTIDLPVGRSISGVVTDTNGNPLSGIYVYPCEQHGGGTLNDCGNPRGWEPVSTKTDSYGKFSTWGVADGRSYVVELSDPAAAHASGFYDKGSAHPLGYTATLPGATPVAVSGGDAGGVTVALPSVGVTPVGPNVVVTPVSPGGTSPVAPVDLTGSVETAGTTSLTTSTTAPAPLPSGFQLPGNSPTYYDLETTATYSGSITVCISYAGITPAPTELLHYDKTLSIPDWVPIQDTPAKPADVAAEQLCGTTTSLSPFALVTQTPLTITADNKAKTYGATLPPFSVTYSYAGLVTANKPDGVDGTLALSTTATAASPVGTYPIILIGAHRALATRSASCRAR